MLIRNASALVGDGLDFVTSTDIRTADGLFAEVRPGIGTDVSSSSSEAPVDCEGLLAIPGFVNAHTHIGDSAGKDAALDGTADQRIHPVSGAKSRILGRTPRRVLAGLMRASCRSMLRKGITTVVDFREGGPDGVALLRESLSGIPLRLVVLGRLEMYHGPSEIGDDAPFPPDREAELASLLGACDGLGVSGANENSTAVLERYSRTGGIRAIHCSETEESVSRSVRVTGRSETSRALSMDPHFLVHMTHAREADLRAAAGRTRGIVVCPRANSSLAEGIPDIGLMQESGCTLAIGTDNVMINSPDMFREMDFLWKVTMGLRRRRVGPREILRMATVNGGRILGSNVGAIGAGMAADCVFLDKHALDLEPMHNPHASVVHRASESAVRAVMIGGEVVHGRLG